MLAFLFCLEINKIRDVPILASFSLDQLSMICPGCINDMQVIDFIFSLQIRSGTTKARVAFFEEL